MADLELFEDRISRLEKRFEHRTRQIELLFEEHKAQISTHAAQLQNHGAELQNLASYKIKNVTGEALQFALIIQPRHLSECCSFATQAAEGHAGLREFAARLQSSTVAVSLVMDLCTRTRTTIAYVHSRS